MTLPRQNTPTQKMRNSTTEISCFVRNWDESVKRDKKNSFVWSCLFVICSLVFYLSLIVCVIVLFMPLETFALGPLQIIIILSSTCLCHGVAWVRCPQHARWAAHSLVVRVHVVLLGAFVDVVHDAEEMPQKGLVAARYVRQNPGDEAERRNFRQIINFFKQFN